MLKNKGDSFETANFYKTIRGLWTTKAMTLAAPRSSPSLPSSPSFSPPPSSSSPPFPLTADGTRNATVAWYPPGIRNVADFGAALGQAAASLYLIMWVSGARNNGGARNYPLSDSMMAGSGR